MAPRSTTQGGKHEAFEDSGSGCLDRLWRYYRRHLYRPCDTGDGSFIGGTRREAPANAHHGGSPPRKGLLLLQPSLLASILSPALLASALLASALLVKSNLHLSIINLSCNLKPTLAAGFFKLSNKYMQRCEIRSFASRSSQEMKKIRTKVVNIRGRAVPR